VRVADIVSAEFAALKGVHASRLKAVARVTVAVALCGRLALSLAGRALPGTQKAKNGIKCVDLLLGNAHLHAELPLFYARIAKRIVRDGKRPVLLIDWTDIGTLWSALVVTFVSEGRGIVLCSETHPRTKENNPRIETSVLKKIQALLPADSKPIIVSDAGFRGPWLRKVVAAGWDFVGRVRGRVQARRVGEKKWFCVKNLWEQATKKPKDLGQYSLAKYLPLDARVVAVWENKRNRHKALPKVGRRKQKGIRAAREPWILVTSLTDVSPGAVVHYYALRMRIELTFRDQKCPRFGLALDQIRTENRKRVEVYLLLATLAHYALMFIGRVAERAGMHRDYQANTVSNRRVLSWARLGREVFLRAVREASERIIPKLPPRLTLEIEYLSY
jgi:Transposase DDE domain